MDEPLAVALKFGFLAVLYLFLLWVSRSALRDLARSNEPVPASDPVAPHPGVSGGGAAGPVATPMLIVVAALGHEPGSRWELDTEILLGRGDQADILVDDKFASNNHARLYPRGGNINLEDLGSTNGTYLNGRQVKGVEILRDGDTIRIGDSEYRFEE